MIDKVPSVEPGPRSDQSLAAATVAALATIVLWASAFVGIRMGLRSFSPAHVALLRYIVASLTLVVWALFKRMPALQWRDLPGLAAVGLVGIAFYNVALGYGQMTLPAATASFLIASVPVFIALYTALVEHERLKIGAWVGIAVSFCGVAVIALGSRTGLRFDPRAGVVLAAAVASAVYSLGQRPFLKRYGAVQVAAYVIWTGTMFLLPFGGGLVTALKAAPLQDILAVVYLGVFPGALGYVLWAYVMSKIPAARAGSFLYLVPAVVLVMAWALLGEMPSLVSVLGGMLIVAGVVAVNTARARRR